MEELVQMKDIVYMKLLDCETEGYFCTSKANCDNSGGNIMQDYSCSGDCIECCDTEPALMTCSYWGGEYMFF